jgi:hypothetical protein
MNGHGTEDAVRSRGKESTNPQRADLRQLVYERREEPAAQEARMKQVEQRLARRSAAPLPAPPALYGR